MLKGARQFSRRPLIAKMMANVVATAEIAAEAAPTLSLPRAVAAATGRLENELRESPRRGVDEQSVTIAALQAELVFHDTTLDSDVLAAAWVSEQTEVALDELIQRLISMSVDGERLAWAVISAEAQRHVSLIHHEANKLSAHYSERSTDDMITYGWIGLRLALRRFDPALGLQFSTYACKRISGAIRDGLRKESHLAKRLITQVRQIAHVEEELAAELGRVPSRQEVAEVVGMTVAELAATARFSVPVSLDELRSVGTDHELEPTALVTDAGITEHVGERDALASAVDAAFQELDAECASVARSVLYNGNSVAEVVRVTGVPARRVRQHCSTARLHLEERLAAWV